MEYSSLIGIPYEEKNCWQLAVEFYRSVLGIELSHIFDGEAPGSREDVSMLILSNKGKFSEVKSPEFGDLVLIKVFGIESHIAVYVGEGRILHTKKRVGSHISRLHMWNSSITGYFRAGGK